MTSHPLMGCPLPPYAAQLRIYEPLAAFPDGEREHWQAYVASGDAPGRSYGPSLEREAGIRALLRLPSAGLPHLPEHAYVTGVDGVTLVCPWRTEQRSYVALADVRAELPEVLADAFVSRAVADAAEQALTSWRAEHPDLHVHLLTSTWQVPVRWFVLVDAKERQVDLGTGPAPGRGPGRPARRTRGDSAAPPPGAPAAAAGERGGRALVYRTAMSRARRRLARALAVLRRSGTDGSATAGVEDLGRWLEEFHPRSLVELDYGGLVHLLDDDALVEDESARDVATALAALAEGQGEQAAAAYLRVTGRMKALQAVESAG